METFPKEQLARFLVKSCLSGYASGDNSAVQMEADGSCSVVIEDGDWKSHDNWFGGEPYGGRLVVWHRNQPIWIMTYYGLVRASETEIPRIYGFLIACLRNMPEDAPFRGPACLTQSDLFYANTWHGTIEMFSGMEAIFIAGELAYSGWYRGGLVNRRGDQ